MEKQADREQQVKVKDKDSTECLGLKFSRYLCGPACCHVPLDGFEARRDEDERRQSISIGVRRDDNEGVTNRYAPLCRCMTRYKYPWGPSILIPSSACYLSFLSLVHTLSIAGWKIPMRLKTSES